MLTEEAAIISNLYLHFKSLHFEHRVYDCLVAIPRYIVCGRGGAQNAFMQSIDMRYD